MIRRWQALAPAKRTNFLRRRVGLDDSLLAFRQFLVHLFEHGFLAGHRGRQLPHPLQALLRQLSGILVISSMAE